MTVITLTAAQHAELDNPFWHIPYTVTIDGEDVDAHTDDDDLRQIPEGVDVGIPGEDEAGTEFHISHPALSWEDEVMILAELDERAAFTALVRAAPAGERAGLRSAKRTELRTQARRDARKNARVAKRRAAAREARVEERQRLRREARAEQRADLETKHAAAIEAARPEEPV